LAKGKGLGAAERPGVKETAWAKAKKPSDRENPWRPRKNQAKAKGHGDAEAQKA
jgi:hypothetical protein